MPFYDAVHLYCRLIKAMLSIAQAAGAAANPSFNAGIGRLMLAFIAKAYDR